MDEGKLIMKQGRLLPQWSQGGAIYHVVLRLKDSLPAATLKAWRADKIRLEKLKTNTKEEKKQLKFYVSRKTQDYLDTGEGSCILKEDKYAQIVSNALFYFNEQKYLLHAFATMPNHVHVIVQPFAKIELSTITHSWKSYSSHEIGKLSGSKQIWQNESFDHIIRDENDYNNAMDYVIHNPVKAKLEDWQWVYDSRNA